MQFYGNSMKILCKKMGINGEGIGYIEKTPVFCEGVLPGETAEVRVIESKKTYMRAEAEKILRRSPARIRSVCRYQKSCGGCALMTMKYEEQLKWKKEILAEALLKYGNVKRHFIREFKAAECTTGYRNQCRLPVSFFDGELVTGMYQTNSNHFMTIRDCPAHDPALESFRKKILKVLNRHQMKAYDNRSRRGIRGLMIRVLDETAHVTLITGKESIPQEVIDDLMNIDGLKGVHQSVNTEKNTVGLLGKAVKTIAGEDKITVSIHDIDLRLSPDSFFQLNRAQAEKLYETAVSKIDSCDTLVEAYCGVGAMSLMAASKAKQVIGIENVANAVKNAEENASLNNISNASFLCADAAVGLYKAASRYEIGCLLADPPRAGMDEAMIEAIMKVLPKKIIYISCNPATLAKNLKELKHHYHVESIIPFDMFPNTPQIESITVLERDNY